MCQSMKFEFNELIFDNEAYIYCGPIFAEIKYKYILIFSLRVNTFNEIIKLSIQFSMLSIFLQICNLPYCDIIFL